MYVSKKLIVPSAALLACFVVGLLFYEQHTVTKNDWYTSTLRNTGAVEEVLIGGHTYTVEHGEIRDIGTALPPETTQEVIRLAYEKTSARLNPILALPGVQPGAFRAAIVHLQQLETELSKKQTTKADTLAVRESLYPVGFLQALGTLEQARLDFLSQGSTENARLYEKALQNTAALYAANLDNFRKAFEQTVSKNAPDYAVETKIITRENTLQALDALQKEASLLQVRTAARISCYAGSVRDCRADDLELPTLGTEDSTAPAESLALAERVRTLYTKAGYTLQKGPFILLSQSVCVKERPGDALLFGEEIVPGADSIAYTYPLYLGDIRFLSADTYIQIPFFNYFKQQGAKYILNSALTHYGCPQVYEDIGDITAVEDVREFALRERLSRYAPGLTKMEETFASADVVSHGDALEYLKESLPLIQNQAVPEDARNELAALTLEITYKTTGLYPLLQKSVAFEEVNLKLSDQGLSIDSEAAYLFFVRSEFTSLFLSGMSPENMSLFKQNRLSDAEQPYIFYSSLEKKGDTSTLIRDTSLYRIIHTP